MFDLSASSDPTSNILQSIKAFEYKKQTYLKYVETKIALRILILNAVDDNYINELEDEDTGYAKVSPLQLMTNLWTSYGTVDDTISFEEGN